MFGCWVFYVCWYYTLQCAQDKLAKLKSSCQPKFGFLVDTNRICEMIEMRAQTLLMIDLSIYNVYVYIFTLYMCNIYSCRRHTHSYPIQLEYYALYDQHFLNHHIIVRFVLSFHHFLPCCHHELTRSRP